MNKHQPVSFGMKSHSLPKRCGIILDGQILKCDIIAFHFHSISAESTHLIDISMIIVGNYSTFSTLTYQLHVLDPRGNYQFFFIQSILYIYSNGVIHKSTNSLHRLLNSTIFSGTITRHYNRILFLLCLYRSDTSQQQQQTYSH